MSPVVHKLEVSVEAHGEQISELSLDRPTGEQVGRIGLPYIAAGDAPDFKMAVVMKYISVLGKVPMSTVNQLDPSDLNDLAWVVCGFFLASAAKAQPKS